MRYSESKIQKIGVAHKRTELTTTIVMFRNKVKWAKIREGCCVISIIVWNNDNMTRNMIWITKNRKYTIKNSVLLEHE